MISRVASLRGFGPALAIFLGSRLVIVVAIQFATRFIPLAPGDGRWDAGIGWFDSLLRWDAGWYLSIAERGYTVPEAFAFYPLYPLIIKALALFGVEIHFAVLIVANLAAILAALLLFQLADEQFDEQTGYLAVGFLGFFPTSVFLSAGYTESMTLCFALGCILLLRRQRLVAAALCAGLAFATRSTGIVLFPIVLWQVWNTHKGNIGELLRYGLICGLLAASGVVLFASYLWITVGDPLRFVSAQQYWQGEISFVNRVWLALTLQPLREIPSEGAWFFIAVGATLIVFCRRVGLMQSMFGLGVLLLPYLTVVGGPARFGSMPRFVLLAFPLYIIMATLCRHRLWLSIPLIGVSAAGLAIYTARFAQWYSAG
ncbi:MAG: hypothetical protein E7813_24890 [Bradyrhizobium sp.]|uniref:mannosyltransferase family protein n=1 Tax=Bradyrhizobium sp. TaxID=376 RepID=UPI0011F428A3|nr:mannosyltransferase family protein [Bradyrhizobium sp.]THD59358.1 MAG: hypothetical protein E7813_24890 [Bradyrhizobium sp.]